MILERNTRIICRPLDGKGMLYDPDRRDGMVLNPSGMAVYAALREFTVAEDIYRQFAPGDDIERRHEVEKFLLMLQKYGYLSGLPESEVPDVVSGGEVAGQYGTGFSMSSTFYPGDRLVTEPVDTAEVKRGDVIRFKSGSGRLIAHRVIGGAPGAWVTMGDNNPARDREIVTGNDLHLVTAVIRGGVVNAIAGGKAGMRHFYFWRFKRALKKLGRAAAAVPVRLAVSCCFWRKYPEKSTDFGRLVQYSACGRVIGWRIGRYRVFKKHKLKFFYRLPEAD